MLAHLHRSSLVAVFATAIVVAIAVPISGASMHQSGTNTSIDPDSPLLAAVQPEHRNEVATVSVDLPRYTIAATLLPPEPQEQPQTNESTPAATPAEDAQLQGNLEAMSDPRIAGTLNLEYVNTTEESINSLPFQLAPNLRQYGDGRMVVSNAHIDGEPVDFLAPALHSVPSATRFAIERPGERDLATILVPLEPPLEPGDAVTVRMDFSTTVPVEPLDESGRFRYWPDMGTWTLGHWFPMLAGYDDAHGWEIDPPAAWSDITFGTTALFDITVTAPEHLTLVTTGVELETAVAAGHRTTQVSTGPVRDVAIVADPNLQSTSTDVEGTTITSWYRFGEESGAETILQWAMQAFTTYSELYGAYPYATLDVISVPGIIGLEFPQLTLVGSDYYPDPEGLGSRPGAVEFVVAHELAHQWWYGLVGSNPHRYAFLDEGLAEYSAVLYFESQHGPDAAASHLREGLMHPYALMLITGADIVVDQPTVAFPTADTYYAVAYRKAGLGFDAIRRDIGDDAFVAGLTAYFEEHRFTAATPDDLHSAFEAASGDDLGDIWTLWFDSDRGRVDVEMEPLPGAMEAATPTASPVASPVP